MTQYPLTDAKPVLLCRYLRDPDLRCCECTPFK